MEKTRSRNHSAVLLFVFLICRSLSDGAIAGIVIGSDLGFLLCNAERAAGKSLSAFLHVLFFKVVSAFELIQHEGSLGNWTKLCTFQTEPANLQNTSPANDVKEKARNLAKYFTDARQKTWSNAVVEVAKMAGMPLKKNEQPETEFIKKVVEEVEDMLTLSANDPGPHLQNLVGMQSRVKDIEAWLRSNTRTDKDGMLVIRGMAGIGKTTTAKFVFEENRTRFHASIFYENIRQEAARKSNYGYKMQKNLYRELIRHKAVKAPLNPRTILSRIEHELSDKRVLVVLDDVDAVEQLHLISIIRKWLTPGSKIIITTTRNDLSVDQLGKYKEHRIEVLDVPESVELFNCHAFGKNMPSEEFSEMSELIVKSCQGHPLALRVLGALVSGQSIQVWRSVLESLEDSLDEQVIGILKLSYESLIARDQNLFLDIACFFVGKKKNKTISILDGCGYYAELGILRLCHRNLLSIEDGILGMHQLLQSMAKHFVSNESDNFEERSRVWRHNESLKILTSNKIFKGCKKIEGLTLDMNILKRNMTATRASHTRGPYFQRNVDEEVVKSDNFQNMSKLRLLKLSNVQPFGEFDVFPTNIRWLSWRWCNLSALPSCFPPESVVSFELRNNSLEQIWTEPKALESLKYLNLSHSSKLRETPDVSMITNLEQLILKCCESLVEIHESTKELMRIRVLNLEDCTSLTKLPKDIGLVESLEVLPVSGCTSLKAGEELQKMKIKELYMDGTILYKLLDPNTSSPSPSTSPDTSFETFPSPETYSSLATSHGTTTDIIELNFISLLPRRNPEISWASLPTNYLVILSMKDCNLCDSDFPSSLPPFPMLRKLYLGENLITKLPEFVRNLHDLQTLNLSWSPRLKNILLPWQKINKFVVKESKQLEEILFESIPDGRRRIKHGGCTSLNHVQNSFEIRPVQLLDSEFLDNIGFSHLEPMENIEVTIVNLLVWSRKKLPIQVLYMLNYMYMSCYPGKEVPKSFNRKSAGSNIWTVVPSTSSLLRGVNVCVVYTHAQGLVDMNIPMHVTIRNETKRIEYQLDEEEILYYGVPEDDEDMVWLLHWPRNICNYLFNEHDEIKISFRLDIPGEFKECGIQFLNHLDEDQESHSTTCEIEKETDLRHPKIIIPSVFICIFAIVFYLYFVS